MGGMGEHCSPLFGFCRHDWLHPGSPLSGSSLAADVAVPDGRGLRRRSSWKARSRPFFRIEAIEP